MLQSDVILNLGNLSGGLGPLFGSIEMNTAMSTTLCFVLLAMNLSIDSTDSSDRVSCKVHKVSRDKLEGPLSRET